MSGAAVFVGLLFLLSVCSACYISNCPIGGKRSITDAPLRKCMSCGPGDRGRCFGPNICCGEGLGCFMGSPESSHCVEENYLLTPCQAGGRPCGSEGGRCAASGLCCDAESCAADQSCLPDDDGDDQASQFEGGDPTDIILRLLHLASHTSHRTHQ
ncbi:isotocin-neurophysin IT 1 [Fundulus heteroclitus]|uniref:isotocin-neurophysin IT 1 n=1 Tax=Fundulus heteroclitus TaxID=8078 RepID=UPI00165AA677|nr:isotocin-neurophysin IT 1 [Fundulus heteroclitus]XP_021175937.2 isotocin-neurophysin IT 1 [Fundulus heteroclitus]